MEKEHPFELMCQPLGIKYHYTRPCRPQTNGKVEAFWKIAKNEFFYPNSFDSVRDLIYNLEEKGQTPIYRRSGAVEV